MPVSNQFNTLNNEMVRNCFIMVLLVLISSFCYEGKIVKKQLFISISILFVLFISTFFFYELNKNYVKLSFGYLLNYISYCILINFKIEKLSRSIVLDYIFIFFTTLLIIIGLLTIVGNTSLEMILKTYYINHYPHIYTIMWESHKTVTFFGTHSIAAYLYFMIWWLLDYRSTVKKGVINWFMILGVIFLIIMCRSVSAILCLGLIVSHYCLKWARTKKIIGYLKIFIIVIITVLVTILTFNIIVNILSSDENGLLGRFGSSGNLIDTIKFSLTNMVPMGINDYAGLWLTDGGFFIQFVRGGLLLVVLYYAGLYNFLKINIRDKNARTFLFISLMLFEVGYQFTMSMRFFMLMLFSICYFNYLYNIKQSERS